MGELKDIKDQSPNKLLIESLEELLEEAKSGEIKSIFFIKTWNDDEITHGWSLDYRTTSKSRRLMLAELMMAQNDFSTNLEFREESSVLARAIIEEE